MPPAATEDADGVTAELSSYIHVEEGPLLSERVEAVKATFKQTIKDDLSLARCPNATRVDPRLWTSMRDSLKVHTKGDKSSLRDPPAEKARELLRGVISSIARRGSTNRSRAFRKMHNAKNMAHPTMLTPAAGPTTRPSQSFPLPPWPLTNPQFSPSLPWYHPQLASPFGGSVPVQVTPSSTCLPLSQSIGQYPFVGFGGSSVSVPMPAVGAFSPPVAGSAAAGATSQPPAPWTRAEKASKKAEGTGGAAGEAFDSVEGLDNLEDLGDGTEEAPGGVNEAVPAAGVAGVDTRKTKDLMQELLDAGITDADATEAVQQLRSALTAAGELGPVEKQHAAAIDGIDIFKCTQLGRYAYDSLMRRGFAIAPVFSSADRDETTRFMSERIHEEYFTETSEDGRLRVPYAKGLRKINDQERWMVNLEEASHKKSLGQKFMERAEIAVQTMGFVLQALVSIDNVVDAEKLTLLLSAAGEANQVLHKDQDGKDVQKRLLGSGSGTRGRSEPAPYTGLCAFREPVYLHVDEASHKDFLKDEYDWNDMVELIIPPGYGILFHSCLVHSGSSYEEINSRLHIYFKCKNGRTTFDNTFHQVKHDEAKQPAARKALPLS
ncbi:unnamed protein product [Ectocarpus sp. CCAP 1310/34]|nr:unnamed protein product [Ectocarpus sp. CCAP 1310/34]